MAEERCEFCDAVFSERPDLSALVQVNAHMLFGGCAKTADAAKNLRQSLKEIADA